MSVALARRAAGRPGGGVAVAAHGTLGAGRARRVVEAAVAVARAALQAGAVLVAATILAAVAPRPANLTLALQ